MGGRDQIDIRTQGENNKMDAKDINMLAKKLEKEGDIYPEEVVEIRNFLKENWDRLSPESPDRDKEAADALGLWFLTVEKKLPKDGNYLRTVPLNSVYKKWKSYNPFCRIIGCKKKLPFPDNIIYLDWAGFNVPSCEGYKEFEYAGDIRSVPEIYEKIKNMEDVFDEIVDVSVSNSRDMLSSYYSKKTLYQTSIVRAAILCQFPIICATFYERQRLLMYPSDIGKLSPLLEYTPDDLVYWARREGYLDDFETQSLLENQWIYVKDPAILSKICDGFTQPFVELALLNNNSQEKDQSEEWVDIIR